MEKISDEIKKILKNIEKYNTNGIFKVEKLIDDVMNLDPALLRLLLSNQNTNKHLFQNIDGVYVFDKISFLKLIINMFNIPLSYTFYKDNIGIACNNENISDTNNIVLNWPYKDCILESESNNGNDKKDNLFLNVNIYNKAIKNLLSPKLFTNWKKYDKDGEHQITNINEQDNLIIKGNNLIVLSSLLKIYRRKVKMIYIDPPYNTGNVNLKYKDNFKRSTWLTFMKNRLDISREFLKDDGVIFVHCDDNEQAYLKVLMDEIYGSKNFVETFIWNNTDNAPTLSKKSRKNIEYIHCYEKERNLSIPYIGTESNNDDAPLLNIGNQIKELIFPKGSIRFSIGDGKYSKQKKEKVEILNDFIIKGGINITEIKMRGKFKWNQDKVIDEVNRGTVFLIKTKKMLIRYKRKSSTNIAPEKYLSEKYLSKAIGIRTNEDSKKHLKSLGLDFHLYPKPESLIAFLIRATTKENDLILDYHLGSGTTATVAHKMNRRYIGIEQMDYIKYIAVERLKKVIEGENGGVSNIYNWKGGGSFIYFELMLTNNDIMKNYKSTKYSNDELYYYVSYSELNNNDKISIEDKRINRLFYNALSKDT